MVKTSNKRYIYFTIILVLSLIFLFRIPYVGSYIDAIFFDYTFGTCKYFLYLAIIVTCTIGMIRYDLFKIIISKRVLIAFTLVLSSLVMIVSGVHHEIIQVLGNDNF
jgi:hypothetical protein